MKECLRGQHFLPRSLQIVLELGHYPCGVAPVINRGLHPDSLMPAVYLAVRNMFLPRPGSDCAAMIPTRTLAKVRQLFRQIVKM